MTWEHMVVIASLLSSLAVGVAVGYTAVTIRYISIRLDTIERRLRERP